MGQSWRRRTILRDRAQKFQSANHKRRIYEYKKTLHVAVHHSTAYVDSDYMLYDTGPGGRTARFANALMPAEQS